MQGVNDNNFRRTEQKLAKALLQKNDTNLPGFSELKIDGDLAVQMTLQSKAQMARDLHAQAIERQRRLQQERDQDVEFSKKIKQDCVDIDRGDHRRTQSQVYMNYKNQRELVKQLAVEASKKQV